MFVTTQFVWICVYNIYMFLIYKRSYLIVLALTFFNTILLSRTKSTQTKVDHTFSPLFDKDRFTCYTCFQLPFKLLTHSDKNCPHPSHNTPTSLHQYIDLSIRPRTSIPRSFVWSSTSCQNSFYPILIFIQDALKSVVVTYANWPYTSLIPWSRWYWYIPFSQIYSYLFFRLWILWISPSSMSWIVDYLIFISLIFKIFTSFVVRIRKPLTITVPPFILQSFFSMGPVSSLIIKPELVKTKRHGPCKLTSTGYS